MIRGFQIIHQGQRIIQVGQSQLYFFRWDEVFYYSPKGPSPWQGGLNVGSGNPAL